MDYCSSCVSRTPRSVPIVVPVRWAANCSVRVAPRFRVAVRIPIVGNRSLAFRASERRGAWTTTAASRRLAFRASACHVARTLIVASRFRRSAGSRTGSSIAVRPASASRPRRGTVPSRRGRRFFHNTRGCHYPRRLRFEPRCGPVSAAVRRRKFRGSLKKLKTPTVLPRHREPNNVIHSDPGSQGPARRAGRIWSVPSRANVRQNANRPSSRVFASIRGSLTPEPRGHETRRNPPRYGDLAARMQYAQKLKTPRILSDATVRCNVFLVFGDCVAEEVTRDARGANCQLRTG